MRIISDTKDYYDCVMRMGLDDDLVYVRKIKEEWFKNNPFPSFSLSSSGLSLRARIIGFCGKIYGVLEGSEKQEREIEELYSAYRPVFLYNMDEVDAYAEKKLKKKDYEEYIGRARGRRYRIRFTRRNYVRFFEDVAQRQDAYGAFFHEHHSAQFVAQKDWYKQGMQTRVVFDVPLKDYGFYRVLDPYTAFQELQMYVANLASPEKPIPEVSDADMLEAKGFDPRWSFRKEPGTKKRKGRK